MMDTIERRVFGAIVFVDDLTDARVRDPLRIHAPGVGIVRNRSGLYVMRELEGHDDYTRRFDNPPAHPARTDVLLQVEDPRQRYLSRSFSLSLPRLLGTSALPVTDEDDVLQPVTVRLWPAAARPVRANWAVLRLTVAVAGSDPPRGLAHVIVETTPHPPGLALRHGMTDRHGDALIVISGVAPVLPDNSAAGLTHEFTAGVTLIFDRQVVRTDAADTPPRPPDPAQVLARRDAQHADIRVVVLPDQALSAGASRRHVEKVTWP